MTIRIAALIPAHLNSIRFPRKVLVPILGLPMIEHVRRRAAMVDGLSLLAVATADCEIADAVTSHGGKVIITSGDHSNGTECVAEAAHDLDVSHVILIQGDEPLLFPSQLVSMMNAITKRPLGPAWNATGLIASQDELDRLSVVKASVGANSRIVYCSRRNSSVRNFPRLEYVRKVLGLIAYTKEALISIPQMPKSIIEDEELIEQMRLIEHGLRIESVPVKETTSSVNEPDDLMEVLRQLDESDRQIQLLRAVLGNRGR